MTYALAFIAGALTAWLIWCLDMRRQIAIERQRLAALIALLEAAGQTIPPLPPAVWTDAPPAPRIPIAMCQPLPPCLRYRGDLLLLRPRRRR